MIAIVNMGPTNAKQRTDGWHYYEVRIDREVICSYRHCRDDGLATCLYLAHQAVEKVMRNKPYDPDEEEPLNP